MDEERADRVIADVGRRIAEVRRELGWTQQQAAERLDMPLKNLQRIEAGMNLTIRTLVRIASGFGITAIGLFAAPQSRERPRRGRPRMRDDVE